MVTKNYFFRIPVIYAGAPADWACKSLDQQGSYDEDCIASKSYAAGVHTITSGTQGVSQYIIYSSNSTSWRRRGLKRVLRSDLD